MPSSSRPSRSDGRAALAPAPSSSRIARHDLLMAARAALPVLVAGLILMLVLVPVSTSLVESVSVFNVSYTHDQLKYQFFAQQLAPAVLAACVGLGACLAFALFRFLLEKRSTTAYFSLDLTRTRLFADRAVVGFIGGALLVVVPFAVSLALNVAALGLYPGELAAFAYVVCGYLLTVLVAFAVASLAMMRAGTLAEAVAFTAALLGGVSAVLWGVGEIARYLLVGDAMGVAPYGQEIAVAPSPLEALSWLNPVTFFLQEGATKQFFLAQDPVYFPQGGSLPLIAGWVVAYAALTALGAFALTLRAGEQAEMAGRAPVLSLATVAVAGLVAVSGAVTALGGVDVAIALAAAAALFALVSVGLLFGPFRGRTPRLVTLACVGGELVVMAAGVVIIAAGGLGYAGRVPEAFDVESVEMSYVGSPSFLTSGFAGVSGGTGYYATSTRSYADAEAIETVRSIHRQLIDSARAGWATDQDDFQQTVVPYDVVVRYRLKSGGELTRYYRQATVGELASMRALDNDAHARELRRAAVTGDTSKLSTAETKDLSESPAYLAYRTGALYAADGILNKIVPVALTTQQRAALESAIADDLDRLKASEVYAPEKRTRATLMFTSAPEADVSTFGYSFNNALLYVTDDWTETMAWLTQSGVLAQIGGGTLDPRIVESITFQSDDPYASVNKVTSPQARYFMGYRRENAGAFWVTQDFGAMKTVSEQDKIAQVLPNLKLGYGMDGGYLAQVKLRGIEAYVYCYLPADLAPEGL